MKNIIYSRFKNLYSIFLSILTFIIGFLFIYHILDIYNAPVSNGQIFTREIVINHLNQMILPLIIYVLSLLGGYLISLIIPNKKDKYKFYSTDYVFRLLPKLDLSTTCEKCEEHVIKIRKYKNIRLISKFVVGIILTICLIFTTIYLFNSNNYTITSPIEDIVNLALYFLPFLLISLAILSAYVIFEEYQAKNILPSIKTLNSLKKYKTKKIKKINKVNDIVIVRGVLLVASISFIVIGIINKDVDDVLKKAITICAECIGLG